MAPAPVSSTSPSAKSSSPRIWPASPPIIEDALVRLHEELGHEVIRQNHQGDWGTPFGELVEHLADEGLTSGELSIGDLNEFYVQASRKFDADPDFAEWARRRVVALRASDPATFTLWRRLLEESKRRLEDVYALLGVRLTPADYMGESAYNDVLGSTCDELVAKGLAMPSEGALCVYPRGFTSREGAPVPLIIRKRDGGYNYDTTDLATIGTARRNSRATCCCTWWGCRKPCTSK